MQRHSHIARLSCRLNRWLVPCLLALVALPCQGQTVDLDFGFSVGGSVNALALQPDGSLVIGGYFNDIDSVTRKNIARVDAYGHLDTTFNPGAKGPVYGAVVRPDGKIWLGGGFLSDYYTGMPRGVARLNADGSVDTTCDANVLGTVHALALQPDGKLLVGGTFYLASNGDDPQISRDGILRLNADCTIDQSFDPDIPGTVLSIAIAADGKIVVGGDFDQVARQTRNNIARVNNDGSLDTSFDPDANAIVDAIVIQPDGRIVIGGYFTLLAPNGGAWVSHERLARLNADGSVDSSYTPSANDAVYALALQADGKLVVGGAFSQVNGLARSRLARLDTDGMLDFAFNVTIDNTLGGSDVVKALAMRSRYGRLLAGGDFNDVNGELRNRLVQLKDVGTVHQSLTIDSYSPGGSTITWSRSGAGPELAMPPKLLYTLDGVDYNLIGTMFRVDGGWRYTGFVPPLDTDFLLQARGQVSSGEAGASGSLVETTHAFHLAGDEIFRNGFELPGN